MRRIKFQGTSTLIYILAPGEALIPGEACLSQEEHLWAEKLLGAMHDVEDRKTFWDFVIEQKKADPAYSIFVAFPKELPSKLVKATDVPKPKEPEDVTDKREIAKKYSADIIAQLKGQKNEQSA